MPPVPDYADPRPAYAQIAADIRRKIGSGEYTVGSRLPANRVLTEHYGVAAVTLRQALDVLRAEKLIATQSTRGTFVLKTRADEPIPGDGQLAAVVAELRTKVQEMSEDLGRVEGNLVELYGKTGHEYPEEDLPGSARTAEEKGDRREQRA
jgi:GntR family transcriptional regulator